MSINIGTQTAGNTINVGIENKEIRITENPHRDCCEYIQRHLSSIFPYMVVGGHEGKSQVWLFTNMDVSKARDDPSACSRIIIFAKKER